MPIKYEETEKVRRILMTLYGNPVAQGRPRFSRQGGFVKAYAPIKSKAYKALIRLELQPLLAKPGFRQFENSCRVHLLICRAIPSGFSQKKRKEAIEAKIRPTTRPDTDNYIKGILDALNGTVLKDDSIVCEINAGKIYSDKPRIEVMVEERLRY